MVTISVCPGYFGYSVTVHKGYLVGVLAMEALHRQVLPFMLRRLKEDVLQDLPPKIIQDYYCELSSLQVWLYEDFAKSKAKKAVEKMAAQSDGEAEDATVAVQSSTHIFQVSCLPLAIHFLTSFLLCEGFAVSEKVVQPSVVGSE